MKVYNIVKKLEKLEFSECFIACTVQKGMILLELDNQNYNLFSLYEALFCDC